MEERGPRTEELYAREGITRWVYLIVVAMLLASEVQAQVQGCEWWTNASEEETEAAWRGATVETVTECLDAGADVAARTEARSTPLHRAAAHSRDPNIVQALLARGADLNARDNNDKTPLHVAAESGPVEVFRALLNAGADIEARALGSWGVTVMHLAASNKDPAMVEAVAKLLVAAGVDPMGPSSMHGTSPMHVAAGYHGNPAVLEALIAAGANIEVRDDSGETPLHWAASFNDNPAILETLLTAGADLEARDMQDWEPLHRAASKNENPAIIEALLAAGAKSEARSRYLGTPLHVAAHHNGNPGVIDALLAAWPDLKMLPTPPVSYGGTALHLLAKSASAPAIKTLLKAGVDPEALNESRESALHIAAGHNRDPAVIKMLIAAGADPNGQDRYGETPLHRASKSNKNPQVIETLVAAGADPNKLQVMDQWEFGGTPLHVAASYTENPAVIEALLRGGGDPTASDQHGYLPLHMALQRNRLAAVEVLTAALRAVGADPSMRTNSGSTPLHLAASNSGNPEVAEAILATGSSPMARDENGVTPLHWAAASNPPVIDLLVAAGSDIDARNQRGETPLHWAATRESNSAAIDRLVAAGANLNALDEAGFTPLHRAVSIGVRSDDVTTVESLISTGADLNAPDQEDNSPLHAAAAVWARETDLFWSGPGTIIELLLDGGADVHARNAASETPWDIVQASDDLDDLKKQDTYWKLNDARFKTPVEAAPAAPPESAHSPTVPEGGSECHVPGYPKPANPQGLGLPWCPASVDFQIRVFALQAAGAQCAIATGSSSTADQIRMRRREIDDLCKKLNALDGAGNCRCPAELQP